MWWVAVLSHASSYLWSDFLSNWVCSLLHFSRQKWLQWLRIAAAEVPLSLASSQVVLAHWSLCKHTWAPRSLYPISSNCSFSREANQIPYISVMMWYPSECFASGTIWTSPHFLLKLPVMTIFLPLFSESVCPYNGSLLFNVTSFPKGNSPKNNKIIHLKFMQTMNHLNSCLFKNRAVVWCWCCRDSSSFEYVPRLCILFYVSPLNQVQNRE